MIDLEYNFLSWFHRPYFIYLFGFLVSFNPINPFLNDFYTTTTNLTSDVYNYEVFPISAYSSSIVSFFIFFIAAFSYYNYVLYIHSLCGLVFTIILWQGSTKTDMEIAQGVNGVRMVTETIFFYAIYLCHHDKKDFLKLTAKARMFPLLGQVFAGFFGQMIMTQNWMGYPHLIFFSLPGFIHGIFLAQLHIPLLEEPKDTNKFKHLKENLKVLTSIDHVLIWVVWLSCCTAGHLHITLKMRTLWSEVDEDTSYNGAIDGIFALLAILSVLISGAFKVNWGYHEYILMIFSSLHAILLFIMSATPIIWVSNLCYIVFGLMYYFITSSLSAEIAAKIYKKGNLATTFGLVGCITAFVNLTLTLFMDMRFMSLVSNQKFLGLGIFYVILGILMIIYKFLRKII